MLISFYFFTWGGITYHLTLFSKTDPCHHQPFPTCFTLFKTTHHCLSQYLPASQLVYYTRRSRRFWGRYAPPCGGRSSGVPLHSRVRFRLGLRRAASPFSARLAGAPAGAFVGRCVVSAFALCGRPWCPCVCSRVCHCRAGLARVRWLWACRRAERR